MDITLSDGKTCKVRTLGIFELDRIDYEPLGPFTYTIKGLDGQEYEAEFDLTAFEEPPVKPDEHNLEEGSREWYDLLTWQTYQGAINHNKKIVDSVNEYYDKIIEYILENCLDEEDILRIVTEEDWELVYYVALIPQLTKDLLTYTLRQTYKAKYKDDEIFDALEKTSGSKGYYNAIRVWESRLMIEMGLTEIEYASLPLEERARKVCALMMNKWFEHLELEDMRDGRKNKPN